MLTWDYSAVNVRLPVQAFRWNIRLPFSHLEIFQLIPA